MSFIITALRRDNAGDNYILGVADSEQIAKEICLYHHFVRGNKYIGYIQEFPLNDFDGDEKCKIVCSLRDVLMDGLHWHYPNKIEIDVKVTPEEIEKAKKLVNKFRT